MSFYLQKIPLHIWVALSSICSKVLSAAVQIIIIKYLLAELGSTLFATYTLLASLLAWSVLVDFGVGYSLQNFISERKAQNIKYEIYIVSVFIFIVPVLMFLLCLSYFIAPYISSMYLSSDNFHSEEYKSFLVFFSFVLFSINSVGAIVYKVLFAEQKGWLANLFISIGWLLGLVIVIAYSELGFQLSVFWAILLFYLPSSIIPAVVLIIKVCRVFENAFLSEIFLTFKLILKRGWGFWLFAIMSTLVLQADYLVMSQRLDPLEITKYAVTMKVFGISVFLYQAVLQALWPVCAELRSQGKWSELGVSVNHYLFYAVLLVLVFTILIILYQDLIFSLLGSDLQIEGTTLLLFGGYFVIRVWTDTYAVLLQSMNVLKPFFILVPMQALISICFQWYFSGLYGINGILIGLILSFFLTVTFGLPFFFYKIIREKAFAL